MTYHVFEGPGKFPEALTGILYDVTGSSISKMAGEKPEVPLDSTSKITISKACFPQTHKFSNRGMTVGGLQCTLTGFWWTPSCFPTSAYTSYELVQNSTNKLGDPEHMGFESSISLLSSSPVESYAFFFISPKRQPP